MWECHCASGQPAEAIVFLERATERLALVALTGVTGVKLDPGEESITPAQVKRDWVSCIGEFAGVFLTKQGRAVQVDIRVASTE